MPSGKIKTKIRILVTGVGAIIGYGIVKSLRQSRYECNIVGMDIYPDAVGQVWCDTFVHACPAADSGYVAFVRLLMEQYHIDLMMFGTEQEIERLAAAKEELGPLYEKLVLNRADILALSNDKWKTFCFLKEHGLPAIPSMIEGDFDSFSRELGAPFLLKPRRSYAGKGMTIIETTADLQYFRGKMAQDQFMVQKLIGDKEHEYTVGVFGLGDGSSLTPIILRRKLSQEGATAKATQIDRPKLGEAVDILTRLLRPIGPTNYQFRWDGNQYYLLEVNPRISSSTSIRMVLGYNEAEMCVDWFVKGQIPPKPQIRCGTVVRYIADWVIEQ